MKTPREILLQRHQSADAKLTQIRRELIAQMGVPPVTRAEGLPLRATLTLWRELIWPARRVWAGLATSWAFLLIANANLTADRPVASAETTTQAAGLRLMFREQNRLIAELSGATEAKIMEPRIPAAPRPRSEASGRWISI